MGSSPGKLSAEDDEALAELAERAIISTFSPEYVMAYKGMVVQITREAKEGVERTQYNWQLKQTQRSRPFHRGPLRKVGGRFRTLHTRTFVLEAGYPGAVHYFDGVKLKGSIAIGSYQPVAGAGDCDIQLQPLYKSDPPLRVWELVAASPEEREHWMHVLRVACEKGRTRAADEEEDVWDTIFNDSLRRTYCALGVHTPLLINPLCSKRELLNNMVLHLVAKARPEVEQPDWLYKYISSMTSGAFQTMSRSLKDKKTQLAKAAETNLLLLQAAQRTLRERIAAEASYRHLPRVVTACEDVLTSKARLEVANSVTILQRKLVASWTAFIASLRAEMTAARLADGVETLCDDAYAQLYQPTGPLGVRGEFYEEIARLVGEDSPLRADGISFNGVAVEAIVRDLQATMDGLICNSLESFFARVEAIVTAEGDAVADMDSEVLNDKLASAQDTTEMALLHDMTLSCQLQQRKVLTDMIMVALNAELLPAIIRLAKPLVAEQPEALQDMLFTSHLAEELVQDTVRSQVTASIAPDLDGRAPEVKRHFSASASLMTAFIRNKVAKKLLGSSPPEITEEAAEETKGEEEGEVEHPLLAGEHTLAIDLPRKVTEESNSLTADLDRATALGIVRLLRGCDAQLFSGFRGHHAVVDGAIQAQLTALVAAITDLLSPAADSLVVLSGAGTSGRIAYMVSEAVNEQLVAAGLWPCVRYLIAGGPRALFKAVEGAEDVAGAAVADLQALEKSGDFQRILLVGISCGLSATYVGAQLDYALDQPALYSTAVMGFNPLAVVRPVVIKGWATTFHAVLQRMNEALGADRIVLNPVVGPEAVTGSTRMKGGSMTKILLEVAFRAAMDAALTPTAVPSLLDRLSLYESTARATYLCGEEIAQAVDIAATALRAGGHIFYIGRKPLGWMAIVDASECPPTFSALPEEVRGFAERPFADEPAVSQDAFLRDAAPSLTAEDCVFYLATATSTLDRTQLPLRLAAERAGATFTVVRFGDMSMVAEEGAVSIRLPQLGFNEDGVELLEFSAKLVLNAISTGAFVLRGSVYGNRMIEVMVSNVKLYHRAAGIVSTVASVPLLRAETALLRSLYDCDDLARVEELRAADASQHVEAAVGKRRIVPVALLLAMSKEDMSVAAARSALEEVPQLRDFFAKQGSSAE